MTASATLFFVLSKVLGLLAQPSNLLIMAGLAGVALMGTRFARAGRRLAATSVVLLALCGLSPLARLLALPLEERFPPWEPSNGPPSGIIVLGGPIDGRLSAARGAAVLRDGAERITAGVELARRYPHARLIFSGGTDRLLLQGAMEAQVARRLFVDMGVSEERVEIEDRSRNTFENAVLTKEIARPQPGERWLLVTSAMHMPRAIGVFRKAGFPVEAYPVDWRTAGPQDALLPFDRLSTGLSGLDWATHEWVGLVVYWLTGRTSELLPGPRAPGCDPAAVACGP